ncbi:MAG: efflux RND transporter periplasmic adaptor subunit, partial [Terriglobales bacterium]
AVNEATLRARMAGIITYSMNYSNYNDAHAYRVGDTVSAGDEVAQIPDLSTLEVDAGVRQSDRGQVRVGDAVTAQAPSLPEVQLSGRVQSISALTSLDFSGSYPPPRIFSLVASLSHPDARLRPNMKVEAKLITRQLHQVALAPAQAVFTRQGQATMYVLEGGRYQPRRVRLLGRNPSEVAVAGVAAGARVALVEPGVKPANSATTAAGAAGLEGGHR